MATTITGTTIDVGPNKLVANSAGNVGIGTASPAKPLDVTGDIRTSTGILFGTDTAAANTLDDYEEGTFTATLTGSTSAPNTAVTATFAYVKIGRQVTINGYIAGNTTGGAGTMWLTGLPFTSNSYQSMGSYMSENLEAGGGWNTGYLAGGSTTVRFYETNNAGAWAGVNLLAGASKALMMSQTYQV